MVQNAGKLRNGVEQKLGARGSQTLLGRKAAENGDRANPSTASHFQILWGITYINARARVQAHLF